MKIENRGKISPAKFFGVLDVGLRNFYFLSELKHQVIDIFDFISVPLWQDPSFLARKYLEEGLNPAQMAAQTFSCRRNVTKQLKRFGIPLRPEDSRPVKSLSQLKFGESIRKKRMAKNVREQKLLTMMRRLRDRGYSFHKIAAFLNDSGVPTKTGRGKWHARYIHKLIERRRAKIKSTLP